MTGPGTDAPMNLSRRKLLALGGGTALASGAADALAALAEGAADPALDQQIVTDWYSGVQQTPAGEEVVAYTDALIWRALDYTKPQGWCGGETGYWALPPGEG